jgi:PAS domain S-box-containing protein
MSQPQPTILCIDDNVSNRYFIQRVLQDAGFAVLEAKSGVEGLEQAANTIPDLIILDVKLPDMNGFEVCDQLRANAQTVSIPILNISAAYTDSRDRATGLDRGADAYLVQPVEPIELLATVRALLRLYTAERSANNAAREWQTTFDAMNDGVCLLDPNGMVVRCNQAISTLLNRSAYEIVGCSYADMIPALRELGHQSIFDQMRQTQKRAVLELPLGQSWVALTIDPILDEQNQFTGAVYWVSDITERKRVEAERALLLVREQEARERSESANRMKDEFLATLSHELRSPLNAMLGWLTLLRTTSMTDDRRHQAMETIERNARMQAQLVEDLLDMSRIIRGNLRLNMRPIPVQPVIEAALDTMRPAADAKGILVQMVFDPTVGLVSGDADRLQQVIWNLLSNAVKFTPQGGRIKVLLQTADSCAEIIVNDSGIGIDAAFLPHVFDRFRQADGSTTKSYSGLGLGLSIVRHIVELHGGTVHADSPGKNQGATFTVQLPLVLDSTAIETV